MRKPEGRLRLLWGVELTAVLLFAGIAVFLVPEGLYQQFSADLPLIVLSLLLLSGVLYILLAYRAWGFEVRDDHLYIQHGVFTKVKSMVPFVRIQHVDTQRNFLERILGLSRVVVYTAGSRGSDVKVKGLLPDDASVMQEKLRDVAIESEDRDAV